MPGTLLLAVARLLLDADTVARFVEPTIADLQREVAHAGASRARRVISLCRGYAAFARLLLWAPFWSLRHNLRLPAFEFRAWLYHAPTVPLAAALVIFLWSMLAWNLVLLGAAALVFAGVVRRWNNTHPATYATPASGTQVPALRINVALVPVSANAGGLIFMLGSVAILMTGFPALAAFLAIAVAGGTALATALFAWHAFHPRRPSADGLGHIGAPAH